MQTAHRTSGPHVGGPPTERPSGSFSTGTRATDIAVDAYASRILKDQSPPEACVDESLGPYITELLRHTSLSKDVSSIPEFESLVELLEEHCSLSSKKAQEALQAIATAVHTGVVNDSSDRHEWAGLSYLKNVNSDQEQYPSLPSSNAATAIKPDGLIPCDLLEDPHTQEDSECAVPERLQSQSSGEEKISDPLQDDGAFPKLGAVSTIRTSSQATTSKKGKGKKASRKEANDLAAALFRPTRARQNSIDSASPKVRPQLAPGPQPPLRDASSTLQLSSISPHQLDAAVEMLWSMNPELSLEALTEATLMANGDVNLAQYVIDKALSAPPVCRHMLSGGCYRSDCEFSHDLEGKSCLFWLRGRCGKGDTCRFLHGLSATLLEDIHESHLLVEHALNQNSVTIVGQMQMTPALQAPDASPDMNHRSTQYGVSSLASHSSGDPLSAYSSRDGTGSQASSWGASSSLESYMQNMRLDETAKVQVESRSGRTFASIAADGFSSSSFQGLPTVSSGYPSAGETRGYVQIPQELWNDHIHRNPYVFYIADPMERYREVATLVSRDDVIDLHFQSMKTFPVVLETVLPRKLRDHSEVWIVTGSGHHVGSNTHQKGGGALESAVISWLACQGYIYRQGRDRNGHGGALLVERT